MPGTQDLRFYDADELPTVLLPVFVPDAVWGDRQGALFARPAVPGSSVQTHAVAAAPRSGADEAWDTPELEVVFLHLQPQQQRNVHKRRKTGVMYRGWLVNDVDRLPNVDQLQAAALVELGAGPGDQPGQRADQAPGAALQQLIGLVKQQSETMQVMQQRLDTIEAQRTVVPMALDTPTKRGVAVGQAEPRRPGASRLYARLTAMSSNPADKMRECLDRGTTETDMPDDWPWAGSQYHEPVAPEYLVQIYSGGKSAVAYARTFLTDHYLWDCKAAKDGMMTGAMVLDYMLLYDGINVLMSAGAELCARKMYAIERTYEDCLHKDDWKSKAMHKQMDVYDITRQGGATRVAGADRAARQYLQEEAQNAKWLAKNGKSHDH